MSGEMLAGSGCPFFIIPRPLVKTLFVELEWVANEGWVKSLPTCVKQI